MTAFLANEALRLVVIILGKPLPITTASLDETLLLELFVGEHLLSRLRGDVVLDRS